ncbi:hypothetical protein [Mucilaginibacter arboris]|uniref:Uncharacterized protein n=1 Tax=Mucilaginibacter arboris TaxID=2682090 RepID=A0A7K1SXG9_9SPHI|nr:hypothetical protein [Mucilaginibacter arboris]MVN22014.1 hypothetical protein [Mucilaginibacter arboris]
MKKILLAFLLLTSCKTQQKYLFQPGDTVKVHNNRFLILDYNKGRKGFFYYAKDLKLGYNVDYFSQERVKKSKIISPSKPFKVYTNNN